MMKEQKKAIPILEIKWWDHYKLVTDIYNGRPTGAGSVIHTTESKEQIAESVRIARGNNSGFNKRLLYSCLHCNNETWNEQRVCQTCARLIRETEFDSRYKDKFIELYSTSISARECARQMDLPWKSIHNAARRWEVKLTPRTNNK